MIDLKCVTENVVKMLENRNYSSLDDSILSRDNQYKYFYAIGGNVSDIIIVAYLPVLNNRMTPSKEQFIQIIEHMIGQNILSDEDTELLSFHTILISDVNLSHDFNRLLSKPSVEIANMIHAKHKKLSKNATKIFLSLLDDNGNISKRIIVEHFLSNKLMFNLVEHRLVPFHQKLTEQEKNELSKSILFKPEYELSQILPKIYTTDPIVKYYLWGPGDIIKIIRTIPNPSIYYRIVSSPNHL